MTPACEGFPEAIACLLLSVATYFKLPRSRILARRQITRRTTMSLTVSSGSALVARGL